MLIERRINNRVFAIDPQQPVGLSVQHESVPPDFRFQNAAAFVEWIRSGERIPGIVQWELLSTCNFKCSFCYIVNHTPKKVFNSTRAIELVDELLDADVIEVILTGGEPLLHPCFFTIYEKLKRCGIIVTIYSNLEMLTDELIECFDYFPPYCIEVGIYGHDEDSYELATGKRAFTRVLANLERLLEIGIEVLCKTPVTTLTYQSIDWIHQWCVKRSIPYIASPNIENGLDGVNLSHFALTGRAYIASEKFHLGLRGQSLFTSPSEARDPSRAFNCGVAKIGAYINYDGSLSPCSLIRDQRYDITKQSFLNAWGQLIKDVLPIEGLPIKGCNPNCSAKPICKMCPALALHLENGLYIVDLAYCQRTLSLWDEVHELSLVTEESSSDSRSHGAFVSDAYDQCNSYGGCR